MSESPPHSSDRLTQALPSGLPHLRYDFDSATTNTEWLRSAVENAQDGLAVLDADGCYLYLNKSHVEMFGYNDADELIGRSWRCLYTSSEVTYIENTIFPVLSVHRHWTGVLTARKKDGSPIHESLTLTLLPKGGIVCNCRDISAYVAATERLRRNEDMFRAFLNSISKGVAIREVNGNYLFLNKTLKQWFADKGMPEIDESALSKCIVNDPVFGGASHCDKHVVDTGESMVFDYSMQCHGQLRILEVEKHTLNLQPGQPSHLFTLVRDVTRQRQLEQQSRDVARSIDEYHAMQREFVAMVSHEFRTPLTSIQGIHFLFKNKVSLLPQKSRPDLDKLLNLQEQALANLNQLVDQVLMINRLDHSKNDKPLGSIVLAEFFTQLIDAFNISLADGRVSLELNAPRDYTAQCDQGKIRTAIQNIISNAIKYSPNDTNVQVKVLGCDHEWMVSIADRGRGIPKNEQEKLFQPFYRASNVGLVPGTGLGLAIVRRVVDFHSGTLGFSSTEGVGTEFILTFPRVHLTSLRSVNPTHPKPV